MRQDYLKNTKIASLTPDFQRFPLTKAYFFDRNFFTDVYSFPYIFFSKGGDLKEKDS